MKPIELHEKAMNFSFLAKQSREVGKEDNALQYFKEAADFESQAADFYFDRPEFEPTRSTLIRSAAFLNLKAGLVEKAEKYIFYGIENSNNELIKSQLYDALELCLTMKSFNKEQVSSNVEYIYKLRQKSVMYSIEPKESKFGSAVTLEMVNEFSGNYLKSFYAYSKSKYTNYYLKKYPGTHKEEIITDEFQNNIKPLLTNAAFGSFKLSLATDFLMRFGEPNDLAHLKSNILRNYHEEVFIGDLTDDYISYFKKNYSSEEIGEIFRPIFNIKANKTLYKVGYYDMEDLKKRYLSRSNNEQKVKLLPVKKISEAEIGEIENTIVHARETSVGSQSRSIIMKQKLKSYNFDYPVDLIEPKGINKIILNEKILLNVDFNSVSGFTFRFDDLDIETTSTIFHDGLNQFYLNFIELIKRLKSDENKSEIPKKYWIIINKLISNPNAI